MINRTCLILDDDEDIREPFVRFLERKGIRKVLGAACANDAMVKIEQEKPDFILLDIQLEEGVDGIEVLRRTKSDLSPASYVVMLSGHKGLFEAKCIELGASEFWSKPMDPREMLEKIKALFQEQ